MKRALIATLYNEADNIDVWWECLRRQTTQPDEIVIVDGGSTDGTWEKLQSFAGQSRVLVKLEQRRCNIAAGRNYAISLTQADIIASTDAGCVAEPAWFEEITRPLLEDATLDVVGGCSIRIIDNDFQRLVELLEPAEPPPTVSSEVYPSSRTIAFRRTAWRDVGGYPEWLTLTAEDALFNFQMHLVGKKFLYASRAIVRWPVRNNAAGYRKMLYGYGYGAAEAQLYAPYFRRRLLLTLCPPLLLLSRHRFKYFSLRYQKNASSALGWLIGCWKGHKAPGNWRRIRGVLLSPAGQHCLEQQSTGETIEA